MASTVVGNGNDCSKWERPFANGKLSSAIRKKIKTSAAALQAIPKLFSSIRLKWFKAVQEDFNGSKIRTSTIKG